MSHSIKHLLQKTAAFFSGKGIESARLDAELLLAHVLGMRRLDLYLDMDRPLARDEIDAYREVVRRRSGREPVAYITERREFYSCELEVSPAVLVPRPDTETLVDRALELLPEDSEGHVIDVGTGSGCIAIALATERKHIHVVAIDKSAEALDVARRNLERHGLTDRVTLRQGDLLQPVKKARDLLAIVGNPPYIRRQAASTLMPEVIDHEPEIALFGLGDDGLGHHRRILDQAPALLGKDGFVALEIGFDQRAPAIALPVSGLGDPHIHQDLGGQPRVAIWRR